MWSSSRRWETMSLRWSRFDRRIASCTEGSLTGQVSFSDHRPFLMCCFRRQPFRPGHSRSSITAIGTRWTRLRFNSAASFGANTIVQYWLLPREGRLSRRRAEFPHENHVPRSRAQAGTRHVRVPAAENRQDSPCGAGHPGFGHRHRAGSGDQRHHHRDQQAVGGCTDARRRKFPRHSPRIQTRRLHLAGCSQPRRAARVKG